MTKQEKQSMLHAVRLLLSQYQSATAKDVANVLLRYHAAQHPYAEDLKAMELDVTELFKQYGYEF